MSDYLEPYNKLIEHIQEMTRGGESLLKTLQDNCDHPTEHIRERGYITYQWLSSTPPSRVCLKCGYAEEGWGCGFWKLNNLTVYDRITDKEFNLACKKFYCQKQLSQLRHAK